MANKIALLKLISGEELIARIKSEPDDENSYYSIEEPRTITLQPTQEGVTFGLGPWVPWIVNQLGTEVRIDQSRLLVDPIEPLPQEIENGYTEQISGIKL